jgi:hypothetical protein
MGIYGESLVVISGTMFRDNPYGEGGPHVCRRAGGCDTIHMSTRPETCLGGVTVASNARMKRGGSLLFVSHLMLDGSFVLMPVYYVNPLNAELNPICHLLALLGARPIFHVGRMTVKSDVVQNEVDPASFTVSYTNCILCGIYCNT